MRNSNLTKLSLAIVLAALAASGCARQQALPILEPGQSQTIIQQIEADSTLLDKEEWLLKAGLAHAWPQSTVFDPETARTRFDQLLQLFPRTVHGATAWYLIPLLDEVVRRN